MKSTLFHSLSQKKNIRRAPAALHTGTTKEEG